MNMLKQIQQMQKNMQKMQEELHRKEVTGEAGAGLVKITMTGKHTVVAVEIDPSLMTEDKDLLEDLVAAAVNDAAHKIERLQEQSFAGLGLPGNFKMPF